MSKKKRQFKAEVSKLLQIITHSLYTNREIFLRELISNASDSLDKLRFEQARGAEVRAPEIDLEIDISADKEAKTLIIADTGVGMSQDELANNLGSIAHSGSEEFLNKLAEESPDPEKGSAADASNIIGRFGVGFYSVFMVADKVTVTSTSFAPDGKPAVWESAGDGSYTLADAPDNDAPARGTRIVVHLKDDAQEFADPERIKSIINRHSTFISFPIKVGGDRVNTIPALWREPKFSVKPEQYEEFYKFLTHDHEGPLDTIHVSVDAPVQFNSLAFIPKHGFDLFGFDRDAYGLDLYVRRVLIQKENKDLIPEYLGFFKGVVDTEDLPLNVSRENLQENALIRKINTTLTKQALSHLEKLAKDKSETYADFWKEHSKRFKLGYADFANRERFAGLLRFNSSIHEDDTGLTSLEDYISRAKEGQKEIYYASGPSREAVKLNPHLEIFRRKGVEVLYLFEPIDEFCMDSVREFKEFTLVSAEHADMTKLGDLTDVDEAKPAAPELNEEDTSRLDKLLEKMKEILGDRVTEVKLSERLSNSPACLVSPDGSITSHMQKIMHIVGKDTSIPKKVLEVNKDHPLLRNLLKVYANNADDPYLTTVTEQLFESSLLMEGYLSDPHKMVDRINDLLAKSSDWYVSVKGV